MNESDRTTARMKAGHSVPWGELRGIPAVSCLAGFLAAPLPAHLLSLGAGLSLNTVTVTWDERDFAGDEVSGSVTFTLIPVVQGNGYEVNPVPKTYHFANGTGQSDPLDANDSTDLTPTGSYYQIVVKVNGLAPRTFTTFLNHANGASQRLSDLVPATPVTPMAQYLPLPSGTPTAGYLLEALGAGETSAWTRPSPLITVSATAPSSPQVGDIWIQES